MSVTSCVRCTGKTSKGKRCKRTTCKYPGKCFQHNKEPLRISTSKIPGSGQGLFAKKEFKKGEIITRYRGKAINKAESDRTDSGYAVEINRNLFVDGKDTQSGFGRWSNDCRARSKALKVCPGNNAKLAVSTRHKTVNVKATKKIKKGGEIYVAYGSHYWSESDKLRKKAAARAKAVARPKRKAAPYKKRRRRRRIILD